MKIKLKQSNEITAKVYLYRYFSETSLKKNKDILYLLDDIKDTYNAPQVVNANTY